MQEAAGNSTLILSQALQEFCFTELSIILDRGESSYVGVETKEAHWSSSPSSRGAVAYSIL